MSESMPPGRPHVLVTLEQLATVLVGLDDGLTLDALLAFVEIPLAAWPLARAGWEQRLVEDLAHGGTLAAELEQAKGRAACRIDRRIEPLDRELRAYLDFERALAEQIDQAAFLARLGLGQADPIRLHAIWQDKLRDPAVQAEALAILNEPAAPLSRIEATPAALPTAAIPLATAKA